MQNYEEISLTLSDGYCAYARYWSAGPRALGSVLYHHGIQSHCGWYEASAQRLVEAGYNVLQSDRRGSGRNSADRGHGDSAEQLISDANAAGDELTKRSGRSKFHVVGVSWGGKLAAAAYASDSQRVQSLSLVTPGLFPKIGVSAAMMTEIGFAMLYEPRRTFDIPLNDATLFTTNSQWATFIASDALTLRQCTAGFYLASRRMDKIVARLSSTCSVPTHLMMASDERIVDNEKTAAFLRGLPWTRWRITRYEGARHSLEFEGDSEQFFGDLVGFVRRVDA